MYVIERSVHLCNYWRIAKAKPRRDNLILQEIDSKNIN